MSGRDPSRLSPRPNAAPSTPSHVAIRIDGASDDGGPKIISSPAKTLTRKQLRNRRSQIALQQAARNDSNIATKVELKSIGKKAKPVSTWKLLGVAPKLRAMYCIGLLFSIGSGLIMPILTWTVGDTFSTFYLPPDEMREKVQTIAFDFIRLGIGAMLTFIIAGASFSYVGDMVTRALRLKFFHAALNAKMDWYDANESSRIVSKLGETVSMVQASISSKFSLLISNFTVMIAAISIAFYESWRLATILMIASPLIILSSMAYLQVVKNLTSKASDQLQEAQSVAAGALRAIRTVKSFVLEKHLLINYGMVMDRSLRRIKTKSLVKGGAGGSNMFFLCLVYAIGFGFGGTMVADGDLDAGELLTVFFSLLVGVSQVGEVLQLLPDIAQGRLAAAVLYQALEDLDNQERRGGSKLKVVTGSISFHKVCFRYPSRPESQVLNCLSFTADPGTVVALCGVSGGGKSTVVSLLQGLYQPTSGSITLDGNDFRIIDLQWLRSITGVVSQEPALFNTTIKENLLFGKKDATNQELEQACSKANVLTFIRSLEKGFDTMVGEDGTQLSGGQKQRIAIARAILKDPKILLLDEATSALDTESEGLVQEALERLMKGRTSIVIAHRMSTIRNANKILVIGNGRVLESGTHEELVAQNGRYARLHAKSDLELDDEDLSLDLSHSSVFGIGPISPTSIVTPTVKSSSK